MKVLQNINHIPWKYVIGMNLAVLVLAVSFVSISSVNKTTENRSQAKEALPTPLAVVKFDPKSPPRLIDPDISWGKVGDAVVIKGENLGTVPFGTLKLGEIIIPQSAIIAWEPNQIVFTIPEKAVTSSITLNTTTNSGELINLSTQHPLTITTENKF